MIHLVIGTILSKLGQSDEQTFASQRALLDHSDIRGFGYAYYLFSPLGCYIDSHVKGGIMEC